VWHPGCVDPPLNADTLPEGEWRCPVCAEEHLGAGGDKCEVCRERGEGLQTCDYCLLAWHGKCIVNADAKARPAGSWRCADCRGETAATRDGSVSDGPEVASLTGGESKALKQPAQHGLGSDEGGAVRKQPCKACKTHLAGRKAHAKHTCTPEERVKAREFGVKPQGSSAVQANYKPKGLKNGYETFLSLWRGEYRGKNEKEKGFAFEEKVYRAAARLKWDGMAEKARKGYQETADRNNRLATEKAEKEKQAAAKKEEAKAKPNKKEKANKPTEAAKPKKKIPAKDAAILDAYSVDEVAPQKPRAAKPRSDAD